MKKIIDKNIFFEVIGKKIWLHIFQKIMKFEMERFGLFSILFKKTIHSMILSLKTITIKVLIGEHVQEVFLSKKMLTNRYE